MYPKFRESLQNRTHLKVGRIFLVGDAADSHEAFYAASKGELVIFEVIVYFLCEFLVVWIFELFELKEPFTDFCLLAQNYIVEHLLISRATTIESYFYSVWLRGLLGCLCVSWAQLWLFYIIVYKSNNNKGRYYKAEPIQISIVY